MSSEGGDPVEGFLLSTSQLLVNELSLIEGDMQGLPSVNYNQAHQIAREIYTTYQEYGLESRSGSAITTHRGSCDAYE